MRQKPRKLDPKTMKSEYSEDVDTFRDPETGGFSEDIKRRWTAAGSISLELAKNRTMLNYLDNKLRQVGGLNNALRQIAIYNQNIDATREELKRLEKDKGHGYAKVPDKFFSNFFNKEITKKEFKKTLRDIKRAIREREKVMLDATKDCLQLINLVFEIENAEKT